MDEQLRKFNIALPVKVEAGHTYTIVTTEDAAKLERLNALRFDAFTSQPVRSNGQTFADWDEFLDYLNGTEDATP